MKSIKYILILLIASTTWGCMKFVEDSLETTSSGSNVTVLEDGRYQVTAQLNGVSMTSVVTRASVDENAIYDGWCLVFGEDDGNFDHDTNKGTGYYSDNSPLIQIEPVTINANGTFTMVFDEYPHTAFMRIVANLTDREDKNFEDGLVTSWRMAVNDYPDDGISLDAPPTFNEVEKYGIATFGQYRHQSVGLDGIYNMTYSTTSTFVDCEEDGGGFYTTDKTDFGYKDVVNYADPAKPVIERVVQYSVQYKTTGGKEGKSTVTGLAETYNTNRPDPANPKTTGFPMASYGFVLSSITEDTLNDAFGNIVDMIRVCSKVQVEVSDSNFTMSEVYLIDAAQESRIRSSVLSNSGFGGTTTTNSSFSIPVDLGDTITYKALYTDAKYSDPIYFYPNSGGDYNYEDGAVDQDINPQYIIIKGQSSYYDTPGYYKVALKAQYQDENGDLSALTYDILRNTSFTVKLLEIDKPGYKTFDDAADPNSPANNISYSMTIESSDNRYEVLMSKGTYYVELETSRVYVKGYMDEGIDGCYVDFSMIPSSGNTVPTVYVQSSDHDGLANDDDVSITHCLVMRSGEDDGYATNDWDSANKVYLSANDTDDGLGDYLVKIEGSDVATKVRVCFDANDSGRIRLRIGDMLKFIPVVYDRIPISIYGTKGQGGIVDNGLVVEDTYGTSWDNFAYNSSSNIYVEDISDYSGTDGSSGTYEDFIINPQGTVTFNNTGNYTVKPELRARIEPTNAGDGNLVVYLRQASDFKLSNGSDQVIKDDSQGHDEYCVEFHSQSMVLKNNTAGLFTTIGNSVVFNVENIALESVDTLVVSVKTTITTVDETGKDPGWNEYFNEVFSEDGQTLTLSATTIPYDLSLDCDVDGQSGTTRGYTRQTAIDNIYDDIIRYENTATSIITVTNVTGDYKEYTVKQKQYPPIYLIDASGETTKKFAFDGSTDYACLFSLNLWNYDASDCSVSYTYKIYKTNDYWIGDGWDGDNVIQEMLVPYLFNNYYINNSYNWATSTDKSATSFTGKNLYNNNVTVTPAQIWLSGGYQKADAIYGVIRDKDGPDYSTIMAKMYLYITVTDSYGFQYTTTKDLYGDNDF